MAKCNQLTPLPFKGLMATEEYKQLTNSSVTFYLLHQSTATLAEYTFIHTDATSSTPYQVILFKTDGQTETWRQIHNLLGAGN